MAGVDAEDQGICLDLMQGAKYTDGDDDDVFLAKDEVDGAAFSVEPPQVSPRKKSRAVSPQRPVNACAGWSVSHRCVECAWKNLRGGRPHHPPPPITVGPASPTLLTLQSLGTTRDSGYEPSPTSAFSFSFTSDEDTEIEDDVNDGHLDVENSSVASGVTPPINIPSGGPGSERIRDSRSIKNNTGDGVGWSIMANLLNERAQPESTVKKPTKKRVFRKRSKSVPELWANEPVHPRTPIVIRSGDFRKQNKTVPIHGRNYSLPATTPDGRPLFAQTPPTSGSRASRERLIDLTEEDPEGSSGHHRRVLVLALPDLLVDLNSLRTNGSPLSSSSSLLSPSGSSSSNQLPSSSRPGFVERSDTATSTPSSASSEGADVVALRPRPTWRRPRALSCDVTLEVEFAQELRKAADDFSKNNLGWDGGVWRTLRNSLGRRFSLGNYPAIHEVQEQPAAHSLPAVGSSAFGFG